LLQPQAVRLLSEALNRPVHAYLLAGQRGTGKLTAAKAFAAALLCSQRPPRGSEPSDACGTCSSCAAADSGHHPDIRIWELNEGEKTFKIEQVRELINAMGRKPFWSERQVHILEAFDAVSLAGANALLKTLEEPPVSSTLILLTRDSDSVLPTLVSRCQVIRFGISSVDQIAETLTVRLALATEVARSIADRSGGRVGDALNLAHHPADLAPLTIDWPPMNSHWGWADGLAAKDLPSQNLALDGLLKQIRQQALVALTASASPSLGEWMACAKEVEEARDALGKHGNARLVFDQLARQLGRIRLLQP
jgi:DNA polymerase III delta' subunit